MYARSHPGEEKEVFSMKRHGCEVEALGISYEIHIRRKTNPLQVLRPSDPNLKQGRSGRSRHVLEQVRCKAKPWEILAIVGPSGAGKSTLLEILAGKLDPQGGSVFVNQKPVDRTNFSKISGFVTQKDSLFPLLTVEETLMFSAKLRLKLPAEEVSAKVKSLMLELGLEHVAKARIGSDRVRGISGGERRRVSIGVEIIHDPKVLILDEPTSGLDSSSALQIIDLLKVMAETRGRTIILSIHQPGYRIVKLFNSVLLLANGLVLHQGTVDQLGISMREMGLILPPHVNIVEFAIESIEYIHQSQQEETVRVVSSAAKQHVQIQGESRSGKITLQQLFLQSKVADEKSLATGMDYRRTFANSRLRETIILTHRFSKNVFRTKELFACRTIQMLVSGLVIGSIFRNIKNDLMGAREKVGLFAFILTFLLCSTTEALPIFLQEREILMRETSNGSYRVSSYAMANGLVYLPFLLILAILFSAPVYWLVGLNPTVMAFLYFLLIIWLILYTANSVVICFSALVPNFIVGNSLISGVLGSFFLFSGYFISKREIPGYWVFMHYISLFKYPFDGFLINEFSGQGKCLQYMLGKCMVSGEEVLREQGYGDEGPSRNVMIMVGFILFYRFIAYLILRFRCCRRSFLKLLG